MSMHARCATFSSLEIIVLLVCLSFTASQEYSDDNHTIGKGNDTNTGIVDAFNSSGNMTNGNFNKTDENTYVVDNTTNTNENGAMNDTNNNKTFLATMSEYDTAVQSTSDVDIAAIVSRLPMFVNIANVRHIITEFETLVDTTKNRITFYKTNPGIFGKVKHGAYGFSDQ